MSRLERVTDSGLDATYGVKYVRYDDSELVRYVQYKGTSDSENKVQTERWHEDDRDVLAWVENRIPAQQSAPLVSRYEYPTDIQIIQEDRRPRRIPSAPHNPRHSGSSGPGHP